VLGSSLQIQFDKHGCRRRDRSSGYFDLVFGGTDAEARSMLATNPAPAFVKAAFKKGST
jgi:hypothetical protein